MISARALSVIMLFWMAVTGVQLILKDQMKPDENNVISFVEYVYENVIWRRSPGRNFSSRTIGGNPSPGCDSYPPLAPMQMMFWKSTGLATPPT